MSTTYAFDPATGRLIAELLASPGNTPAERADLTDVAPPTCAAGQVPFWDGTAWACQTWPPAPTLADLKAAKWATVKARRDQAEYGDFAWDGSTFNADVESRNRIMGAVQLAALAASAGQPYSVVWTLADNSTRTLDAADMIAVGSTLGARVGAAHANAASLRSAINAAADEAALDAIDVSTGWPT